MITPGAILIEKGTLLPKLLRLADESDTDGWALVASGHELRKELVTAGWTFFYIAGEIRATAFGFDRQKMIHAALTRLITDAKAARCNCLEIDNVATRSFLGVPYMSVSAHSRHIQKGVVFSGQ